MGFFFLVNFTNLILFRIHYILQQNGYRQRIIHVTTFSKHIEKGADIIKRFQFKTNQFLFSEMVKRHEPKSLKAMAHFHIKKNRHGDFVKCGLITKREKPITSRQINNFMNYIITL